MEENHVHIYLKLYDFEDHPNVVSRVLDLTPTKVGVSGEKFYLGNNHQLERVHRSNFWEYKETHYTDTKWQQEYVDDFVKRIIRPRVERLRNFTESGNGELALVPYYYDVWNTGFDFNLDLLKTIVDCGLVLDMDIYCLAKEE